MHHVPILGMVLALALGLVSLALLARLPERGVPSGARWLPVTLLLYNLWVAAFLATASLQDRAAGNTALGDFTGLILLGLALAWLSSHIAQLHAFVPLASPGGLRLVRRTIAVIVCLLVAAWGVAAVTANRAFLLPLAFLVRVAVFPAALAASGLFLLRSRQMSDQAWRARYSSFGFANVALWSALSALSIAWGRLAAVSPELPLTLDVLLELLYNAIAVVWVIGMTRWQATAQGQSPIGEVPVAELKLRATEPAEPKLDRSALFAARGITRREAEIIELICEGKTNQEIADRLFISLTTVKDHNYVTFQKLGVRNRTELARLVLAGGATQPKSAS